MLKLLLAECRKVEEEWGRDIGKIGDAMAETLGGKMYVEAGTRSGGPPYWRTGACGGSIVIMEGDTYAK